MLELTFNTYLLNILMIPQGQRAFDQVRDFTSFMQEQTYVTLHSYQDPFPAQFSFISLEPLHRNIY